MQNFGYNDKIFIERVQLPAFFLHYNIQSSTRGASPYKNACITSAFLPFSAKLVERKSTMHKTTQAHACTHIHTQHTITHIPYASGLSLQGVEAEIPLNAQTGHTACKTRSPSAASSHPTLHKCKRPACVKAPTRTMMAFRDHIAAAAVNAQRSPRLAHKCQRPTRVQGITPITPRLFEAREGLARTVYIIYTPCFTVY